MNENMDTARVPLHEYEVCENERHCPGLLAIMFLQGVGNSMCRFLFISLGPLSGMEFCRAVCGSGRGDKSHTASLAKPSHCSGPFI